MYLIILPNSIMRLSWLAHSSTAFHVGLTLSFTLTFVFIIFLHANHAPAAFYIRHYRLSCSPQQISIPAALPLALPPPMPPALPSPLPPALPLVHPPAAPQVPKPESRESMKNKRRLQKLERELALARVGIRKAVQSRNYTHTTSSLAFIPTGSVYRNPLAFYQSHIEMEKRFKIWVYKEGERPIMHQGPVNGLYGIEGQFIYELENGLNRFRARNPDEAHVFFMPWSIANVVRYLYRPFISFSRAPLHHVVLDYTTLISQRHPFWNRSSGADHFMLSCHDWAPGVSKANQELFKNMIRALCNANTSEGFRPKRDISIPEVKISLGELGPPNLGVRISKRKTLAFFAGREHGNIRSLLFKHWSKKDEDVQVYKKLQKNQNYFDLLGNAKYCLCPSGYEVASPRVVEAIQAECVPVLISNNYSLPFNDVLDWTQFSVFIRVADIPDIKTRLEAISIRKYLRLVKGVRSVKRHFTLNRPAKQFDLTHMILHSIWLRRLNLDLISSFS